MGYRSTVKQRDMAIDPGTRRKPRKSRKSCRLATANAEPDNSGSGEATLLPRLTPEQQELVAQHLGLVGVHLRTHVPTPHQPKRYREYDDLFQHGCVALARAAARYQPHRDGVFAAYAFPRIRGAIHNALYDLFTVVHVPSRAIYEAREKPIGAMHQPPMHVQDITNETKSKMITHHTPYVEADTIRQAIRRRMEVAVKHSLEQMRARVWRYRNPCEIMVRIAYERMLIDDERFRTPLRQIAREAGVSSGRACDYERQITDAVADCLKQDPQMRVLVDMAREEGGGWDAIMDESRQQRLMQAELSEFEARFTTMEPLAQACVMYSLIERSSQCIPEVARNLFRLTMRMDDGLVRTVA